MTEANAEPCSYSLPHYRHLLRKAKQHYWLPRVRDVAQTLPERAFCLIRHDIDLHPWAALTMAELERDEGVSTTYYFRMHAPYYNLLDAKVLDVVKAIAAMGHEVGFHYEPEFYSRQGRDAAAGIRHDIAAFEHAIGFRTHSIAQHEPARGPVLGEISKEHPCAYKAELVRQIPYFGDSGYRWREGCVCQKLGKLHQLHTLIHPHGWVLGTPWKEALRAQVDDLGQRMRAEVEAYIASVEVYLVNRARIDRERAARYERAGRG